VTQCVPNLNPSLKTIRIEFSNCGNKKPESLPKIMKAFERNVYLETIWFGDDTNKLSEGFYTKNSSTNDTTFLFQE
jgi:hypothetical protein